MSRTFGITLFVLFLVGCSPSGPSSAAPDLKATETRIAFSIFATQTANAPTVVVSTAESKSPLNTPTAVTVSAPTPTGTAVPTKPSLDALFPAPRAFKHNYAIKADYDRFHDVTTVMLTPRPLELNVKPDTLLVGFEYKGTTLVTPSTVRWEMGSTSRDWQFLKVREMSFLLDGSEHMSYPANHDGEVGSGAPVYVYEWVLAEIPVLDFLHMVNSTSLEIQVMSSEVTLSPEQMEALRDLASRMKSADAGRPTITPTPEPTCDKIPPGQGGLLLVNRAHTARTVAVGSQEFRVEGSGQAQASLPPGRYTVTVKGVTQTGIGNIEVIAGRCGTLTLN